MNTVEELLLLTASIVCDKLNRTWQLAAGGSLCVALPEAPLLYGWHSNIPQFLEAGMEEVGTALWLQVKPILLIDI